MEEILRAEVECLRNEYKKLLEENELLLKKLKELLDKDSEIEQEWYSDICEEIKNLISNIKGC